MTGDPFVLQPLNGSSESLLLQMGRLLPEKLLPEDSTVHPLALLLYDRGLKFWESRWVKVSCEKWWQSERFRQSSQWFQY